MSASHRLSTGGNIDRSRALRFRFNGREYQGFQGDTLASALLANGVKLVGRSFKYHRPRGLFCAGSEEPNALVQLGEGSRSEPNLKATQVELFEGLVAKSVNSSPSPRFDLRALNQLGAALMPAGFYYKTFIRPNWMWFEGTIRRAAGLGLAPVAKDPDLYDEMHVTVDVLVVGAGPAGMAAAHAASGGGARVLLVDDQHTPGGSVLWCPLGHQRNLLQTWLSQTRSSLGNSPNFQLLTRTLVTGYYDHNSLTAVERLSSGPFRQRLWRIRARRVVLATGATERPLVFGGNDRPGVMLADSVLHYLVRYGVAAGQRAVVFTNNNHAYKVALALKDAGIQIAAIVDATPSPAHRLARAARERGIQILSGSVITQTRGARALRGVKVSGAAAERWIDCDLLCVSGGWSPNVHLHSQSGGNVKFDEARAMFVPDRHVQSNTSVGAANGTMTVTEAIKEGFTEGIAAAASLGLSGQAIAVPALEPDASFEIHALWSVSSSRGKAFVDLASDVTADDVALAARENYRSVEHLKRYTTLGMGVDQGRTSNVNGLAIMGELTNRAPQQVGTTRFRPPFSPVTLGTIAGPCAGELFRPLRYLPAHDWHVAHGAVFEEFGSWLRPVAYPQTGETWEVAARREATHVRNAVGLFDGSPLGKIEVAGPDAGTFLDRIYLGSASTLAPGRTRYGLMLNENGVIIDDGVFARLAPDRFLVHTTSAGAERVYDWLEDWLQCEFTDLDVVLAPVTTQWATLTLSGASAREVLRSLAVDIDLSAASFPHMAVREGRVQGIPARICRISFTGELSYEISIPNRRAPELIESLMRVGKPYHLAPYGVEALMILRTEKGYLHVGVDTDGTTLPDDVGMGDGVARKASDFAGRRSLLRSASQAEGRLQLVGLSSDVMLPVGAQVTSGPLPCISDGYVTSSVFSPTLSKPIALALVRNGRRRMGQSLDLFHLGQRLRACIVPQVRFDEAGARVHA